jgi:hypothetical protein
VTVLLANAVATLFMTGLIWFVQIVHYPLFAAVGSAEFPAYSRAHQSLTTFVVGPPMLIEALTASVLVFVRPAGVPAWLPWSGLVLVGVIWISTALLQIPAHGRLSAGFSEETGALLVSTNGTLWSRTTVNSGNTAVGDTDSLSYGHGRFITVQDTNISRRTNSLYPTNAAPVPSLTTAPATGSARTPITFSASATDADGGTLYLLSNAGDVLEYVIVRTDSLNIAFGGTTGKKPPFKIIHLYDRETGEPQLRTQVVNAVINKRAINIRDAYANRDYDFTGTKTFDITAPRGRIEMAASQAHQLTCTQ